MRISIARWLRGIGRWFYHRSWEIDPSYAPFPPLPTVHDRFIRALRFLDQPPAHDHMIVYLNERLKFVPLDDRGGFLVWSKTHSELSKRGL